MKIVLVTGGFDPLHSGHIAYFEAAKKLGDILVVGLNSDEWLKRKKGRAFMPWVERSRIVKALKPVDYTVQYNDNDGSSKAAIKQCRLMWPSDTIVFANGGDRTQTNIPEMDIDDTNVEFVFGVGGENKMNSSSWILEEWKNPKTERQWGHYRVLYESPNAKVKELVVDSGKSLSMQRHQYRNEHWHIVSGTANVKTMIPSSPGSPDLPTHSQLYPNHTINIPIGRWHQLSNQYTEPLKLVEIQYGEKCVEEDIERK
jgi:cytidyltransferase-like protein